ncbi:hypothetical protein C8F01DRAFT_1238197 [Mycena amicta]|nr:hypothetical protein C8F01DRAFT_1238197 [Mycena amicta]
MPPPVVIYVVVAVATISAAVAFKEFVYEPHIAPKLERWAENFLEKRRIQKEKNKAKNQKRAVPVPASGEGNADAESMDNKSTYELETLVANEVTQWRDQIDIGRGEGMSTLRQRRPASTPLDESNIVIPYDPMTPTHVLFDDSLSVVSPSTTTSTMSSRVATPLSNSHSTLSHESFRSPPSPLGNARNVQAPPTPEPSVHYSPSPTPRRAPSLDNPFTFSPAPSDPFSSPHHVPSLSLSHPVDLAADAEHDLELLSAPSSSRPSSPSAFSESAFSHSEEQVFHSFTMSPSMMLGSASPSPLQHPRSIASFPTSPEQSHHSLSHLSESGSEIGVDDDLERWSNAGSEIMGSEIMGSESSWASAGARNA